MQRIIRQGKSYPYEERAIWSTPDITLASGHTIPQFGLGTWMLRGQQCKDVVKEALEMGYTHLDSAWMYENQDAIGQVLKESRGRSR